MPAMSPPDGRDLARVARGSEPVMDCRADRAAPDRRLPFALVPGDEEEQSIAPGDGLLESPVDRPPGAIEAEPMKIDDAVGVEGPASKPPVPAAVERRARGLPSLRFTDRCASGRSRNLLMKARWGSILDWSWIVRVA
jgi:hypothetical protein